MSSDPHAQTAAAYALGALGPDQRRAYEAHLASCDACRTELADVHAVMPFLQVSDESDLVEEIPPLPDTVLPRLLLVERDGRRRRRTVRLGLGATAAVLLLVLGAVVLLRSGGGADSRPMAAVQPTSLSATAVLEATGSGTRITVRCWDRTGTTPAGYAYTLSARSRSGQVTPLGTWRLDDGPITFTTGTSLPADQIAALDISDTDGTTLLELRN